MIILLKNTNIYLIVKVQGRHACRRIVKSLRGSLPYLYQAVLVEVVVDGSFKILLKTEWVIWRLGVGRCREGSEVFW